MQLVKISFLRRRCKERDWIHLWWAMSLAALRNSAKSCLRCVKVHCISREVEKWQQPSKSWCHTPLPASWFEILWWPPSRQLPFPLVFHHHPLNPNPSQVAYMFCDFFRQPKFTAKSVENDNLLFRKLDQKSCTPEQKLQLTIPSGSLRFLKLRYWWSKHHGGAQTGCWHWSSCADV